MDHHSSRSLKIGLALITVTAIGFGLITPMSKFAYQAGARPEMLVIGRFIAFTLIVGSGLILRDRRLPRLSRRGLRASVLLSLLVVTMSGGYLGSVNFIPVTLAALLFYTFPLMVVGLAAATGRDALTPLKIGAAGAAFAGLALALGPSFTTLDVRGVALALGAAVSVCIVVVFSRSLTSSDDPLRINFFANFLLLLAALPVLIWLLPAGLPQSAIGWLTAISATILYVIAYLTWFAAMRRLSPVIAAAMLNLEPAISIVTAYFLLDEHLSLAQIGGVILVLGTLVILATVRPKNPHKNLHLAEKLP